MGYDAIMFRLDSFVADCRGALRAPDPSAAVAERLRDAFADRGAVAAALAEWRASNPGAMAIHRSADLTVLHAAVPPGTRSPAHEHLMWAVIGVYEGQENNTFYRLGDDGLDEVARVEIAAGSVQVLPADAVHRIANPLDVTLNAIHVYGGDLFGVERSTWSDETGERTRFDLAALMKNRAVAD